VHRNDQHNCQAEFVNPVAAMVAASVATISSSFQELIMCLAIPVRVIEVLANERAIIDLSGVRKEISTALLDTVAVGDYVILHVGFAIGKLDPDEALRTLALFDEIAGLQAAPIEKLTLENVR
jgi:hydrogenase expression/formation protein HypC